MVFRWDNEFISTGCKSLPQMKEQARKIALHLDDNRGNGWLLIRTGDHLVAQTFIES